MSNSDDFSPVVRNSALWSGDSRRIAKGDAAGVVMEKIGMSIPDDISEEEHVKMGLVMQPVIARIFEDTHGVKLKDLDVALTSRQHPWLRSHFDYEGDGYLVECKNYHAQSIQYFSDQDEPIRIPEADYAQCLHEAIVHGCNTVYLAVLFGGQRYRDFKLDFTDDQKEAWIKRLAEVWGAVQTQTVPPPTTTDQARDIWPIDDGNSIVADKKVEFICGQLVNAKERVKALDVEIEKALIYIQNFMGTRATLLAVDGKILATWKTAKSSKRFNSELFKQNMPDVYAKFVVETAGSRRFLVK